MTATPTRFIRASIVNEGKVEVGDVLIARDGTIGAVGVACDQHPEASEAIQVDAQGLWLMPGAIDDQVHFREPGLTQKGEIATESAAAAAGGITSFMEMPNTVPQALKQQLLEDKYERAAEVSAVNYSFFMGASNDNLDEVLKTDPRRVCGVKVFMGSSTGNMLVDNRAVLGAAFKESPTLVATHCEDEATIRRNSAAARERYGECVPIDQHPLIRSAEACYRSSSMAVELAEKSNTRLHILHISTAKEVGLFRNDIPSTEKRITAEACIHHLWFTDADYASKGTHIKWNPAVKTAEDREAIRAGILNGRIDVVATDHAPHTEEEKSGSYFQAPSGGPLVQHALPAMLEMVHQGVLPVEEVVNLMAHRVADLFDITDRGYIRAGHKADLVLVDPNDPWKVTKSNILYKCGWSPFEGSAFKSRIRGTWVNGVQVYNGERILTEHGKHAGERLAFNR
ncbi:MAG: dihydroorotase [Crocinitomicaceae bacterium TMED209]|nr:MAG: dihydroorotase [Crocinitomicaceae bacterium TMED209]